MTRADWVALAFTAFAAFLGLRKGLVGSALSLAGVVAGALLGAKLAPHVLGGEDSPYTPVVALAGAAFGAFALETIGTLIGNRVRGTLSLLPPLRAADALGGFVLGAAAGLAVVWVAGAVALHIPGQTDLRRGAQRSTVLRTLNGVVPPARLMDAIARVDPFPAITGPAAPVAPPDPALARHPVLASASANVVRVLGTACGLAVSGSGWIPRAGFVVTAAHVVAGQRDTVVVPPGEQRGLAATAYAFDARNDVAVLRVPGLPTGPRGPLRLTGPTAGEAVAILGYPENRGLTAVAGRIGRTAVVFSEDAYGRGPVPRRITSLRGEVRRGNSGGPALNARGGVEATVFASRPGGGAGFGVPADVVRAALRNANAPVSTGKCTG